MQYAKSDVQIVVLRELSPDATADAGEALSNFLSGGYVIVNITATHSERLMLGPVIYTLVKTISLPTDGIPQAREKEATSA